MSFLINSDYTTPMLPVSSTEEAGRVASKKPLLEKEASLYDSYMPSEPQEETGIYTRDSVIQRMREAQESAMEAQESAMEEKDEETLSNDPNGKKLPNELDEADKDLVERLEQRDLEVRSHEQSHVAQAGEYARGAPTYTYQMGPDGKSYAVGGSLAVDVGKEADPVENQLKSQTLQAAAMGVDEPSAADAGVFVQAASLAYA